jgi:uncharacterized protein YbjT (DUF2867 family)
VPGGADIFGRSRGLLNAHEARGGPVPKLDVLVVGATGRQGSAVARALMRAGFHVRALTRSLAHPVAESLRLRGARLAWADLDDEARVAEAMKGVDAVFAVTTPFEAGAAAEVRHGVMLVELARRSGVSHFVYSSVPAASRPTGVPHHDSKHEVERHLRARNVPHTIVSSAFFMDNLLEDWWQQRLGEGLLPLPLREKQKLQLTALADVGAFVRLVLERRAEFMDRRIAIASDELSPLEMSAILARALRQPVEHVGPGDRRCAANAPPAALDCAGQAAGADVVELRNAYPEVNWHTLDGWAARQSWSL